MIWRAQATNSSRSPRQSMAQGAEGSAEALDGRSSLPSRVWVAVSYTLHKQQAKQQTTYVTWWLRVVGPYTARCGSAV